MPTFAELLTEYMRRTGISDSDLARTLGVRRQTIFRWKEGLVERPRHREDVLRCAERLRLTSEERDELLLAAGFSPQDLSLISAPVMSPTVAPLPSLPEPAPLPTVAGTSVPRALPVRMASRRVRITAAILSIVIVAGVALSFALRSGDRPAFPVVSPGETLIVIAPPGESVRLTTVPDVSQRRLVLQEPRTLSVPERVQVALEREFRAARLVNARVAFWPQTVHDASSAEMVRQRSGAKVVIWLKSSGESVQAALAVSPPASRADDVSLDALVCTPTDAPVKLRGDSPEQVQAFALLVLSQLQLEQGNLEMAHAALVQSSSRSTVETDTLATFYLFTGYVHQIARPPDLNQAVQFYSQTIELAPETASAYLNRGVAYIRQNKSTEWQADFAHVLALKPDDASVRRALCWAHALDEQPQLALPHCDAAVKRDSTARSREARGVVYAELGRLSEAASDLQAFLDWLAKQPASLRARYGTSRADWVQTLKAGQQPIDAAVLARLRQE